MKLVAALFLVCQLAEVAHSQDKGPPSAMKEVMGVRLGMSMNEAVSALAKQTPPLLSSNSGGQVSGNGKVPGLPGSDYVNMVRATNVYKPEEPVTTMIDLIFSPPPAASRLVRITRTTFFRGRGPTAANLETSLREKYGNSSFGSDCKNAPSCSLFWLRSFSGAPMPKALGLGDAGSFAQITFMSFADADKAAAEIKKTSVGLYVEANFKQAGGVVDQLRVDVRDVGTALEAYEQTSAAIKAARDGKSNQDLEKAKKQKVAL